MISARSTPNIALIKYWGNRDNELRLPMADSLSMTLDRPHVAITIDHADTLTVQSFKEDGSERSLKEKDIARYQKHLELTKRYLVKLGAQAAIPAAVSISIHSHIPPAVGLASSAAVFSCLAKAYAGLVAENIALSDEQVSVIARLGSGSAARSIFGGYSSLVAGAGKEMYSSFAEQIADENHWPLYDIILMPSQEEKAVGSTEGHALAHTSAFYEARIEAIRTRRQMECVDAVLRKDFEKLLAVTEEDCLDMHNVMETSTPPLRYLNDETHRIVREIKALRTADHVEVLFTMDAGPTVHLICTESARPAVLVYAASQKNCTLYETAVGSGAHLIDLHGSPIPPKRPLGVRTVR